MTWFSVLCKIQVVKVNITFTPCLSVLDHNSKELSALRHCEQDTGQTPTKHSFFLRVRYYRKTPEARGCIQNESLKMKGQITDSLAPSLPEMRNFLGEHTSNLPQK